jgi:hypothetical protein
MSRGRRSMMSTGFAGALVLLALLSGCAQPAPDLAAATATQLQADVLAVSTSSAAGDLPGALAALDTLKQHTAAARAGGELSASRQTLIEASIALVSDDLAALELQAAQAKAAAERAAAAPTEQPTAPPGENKGKGKKG